jgi:hypothetical protein
MSQATLLLKWPAPHVPKQAFIHFGWSLTAGQPPFQEKERKKSNMTRFSESAVRSFTTFTFLQNLLALYKLQLGFIIYN